MALFFDWLPFRFSRKQREADEPSPVPVHRRSARDHAPPQRWMEPLWDVPTVDPLSLMRRMDDLTRGDSFFGDFSGAFSPALDVSDDETHLEVVAELPGLTADDVRVDVQPGVLVLSGEKHHESEGASDGYYRVERSFGTFRRAVPLPSTIDIDEVDASFKNGLLTVRLAKQPQHRAGSRRIEVQR